MNPMALMKIMNAKNKFNASHPKFGAFLNAAFAGGIQEGTIIEMNGDKTGRHRDDNQSENKAVRSGTFTGTA